MMRIILVSVLLAIAPTKVFALSCAPVTPIAMIPSAPIVFVGVAEEVEEVEAFQGNESMFTVLYPLRGLVYGKVTVEAEGGWTTPYRFNKGEHYLVFAKRNRNHNLSLVGGLCSPHHTKEVDGMRIFVLPTVVIGIWLTWLYLMYRYYVRLQHRKVNRIPTMTSLVFVGIASLLFLYSILVPIAASIVVG
jgi:hypothetical protein